MSKNSDEYTVLPGMRLSLLLFSVHLRNKPKLIPLADDVKKMHMYLNDKQNQYYKQLVNKEISRNWSNLAKVILAQIILFN